MLVAMVLEDPIIAKGGGFRKLHLKEKWYNFLDNF